MDHLSLPVVAAQRQAKGTLSLVMETDYLQIQPVNTGQIFFLLSHGSSGIGGARGETIYIHIRLWSSCWIFLEAFSACMVSTEVLLAASPANWVLVSVCVITAPVVGVDWKHSSSGSMVRTLKNPGLNSSFSVKDGLISGY